MRSEFFYRRLPKLVFAWRRLRGANYEREMELLDVLCDRARTGIDVGAKIGMYTHRILAHSSDVVAFEPIPLHQHMLRAVFAGKRVRVEPLALSDRAARAVLRMPFDRRGSRLFGRSTIEPENRLGNAVIGHVEEIEVETRPLDAYGFTQVGFVKIDVEGHELAVLEGAARTLAAERPNLLVECNAEHHSGGPAALGAWLAAHDYEAFFMDGQTLQPIASYDFAEHWRRRAIENFVAVHKSRGDVRDRLARRVATLRIRRSPDAGIFDRPA